jgi:hypothetical protein
MRVLLKGPKVLPKGVFLVKKVRIPKKSEKKSKKRQSAAKKVVFFALLGRN